jgi:hypothetical protein
MHMYVYNIHNSVQYENTHTPMYTHTHELVYIYTRAHAHKHIRTCIASISSTSACWVHAHTETSMHALSSPPLDRITLPWPIPKTELHYRVQSQRQNYITVYNPKDRITLPWPVFGRDQSQRQNYITVYNPKDRITLPWPIPKTELHYRVQSQSLVCADSSLIHYKRVHIPYEASIHCRAILSDEVHGQITVDWVQASVLEEELSVSIHLWRDTRMRYDSWEGVIVWFVCMYVCMHAFM